MRWTLTVLGTTDLHGNVFNWDYYRDAEYDDGAHDDVGLAKVASVVGAVRAEREGLATLVLDAGDTIEGTLLTTFYARREPITSTGEIHPMARAMNVIGYDAVTLGNHEFNYGLPLLDLWISQLDCPALAANAISEATGEPAYAPYLLKEVRLAENAPAFTVGILGLTNPGTAVWDRGTVAGKLRFEDMVATAAKWVPEMRKAGADLVLVSAHGGDSGTSTLGPGVPNENPTALIAQRVPGIDAILFGHAHAEVVERFHVNEHTGERVLTAEPSKFGQRVSRMDFTLRHTGGRWVVEDKCATMINTNTVEEDPTVLDELKEQHARTVAHTTRVVATSTVEMSAAESRLRPTPILGFVHRVQTDTVRAALADNELPVLSVASPFSRTARFPAGEVCVREIAGLYVYDNALEAVELTGAQVRAYLEYSARYYRTHAPGAPVDPATISVRGRPDFNYDTIDGIDYDIDISRPAGERITRLEHGGAAVAPDARFVVAVNNYRRSGGGAFPGMGGTPLYSAGREIRELLIDWARARGTIDPADFSAANWRLVRDGVPLFA
ncbi:multifunctional 2',3'-cyclic-nucleotide 2'-phosphodiesterase/5'-nucleotidase/3'-nucleotidase [Virgisporangium aliadipatigenens]|uniref:Multifunctional 2',3'-cyclic-nucleotide 2'-phosphodiesterase/5'-nucleotidase/3'-nucleotidase n=1 Tax=Virgisporangium aliadipatigenens TaxID=741659 RepID=A0A8J3YJ92_9ACTN|nr:5'-nucleotidase C-terminal domain-containing protein [Virgisporangium aliadipatigenens]GIJ44946.1 multifunctional 2',3'-cyclic-nucleotide 2'-phosphodiesterase/5'-nucleotidase/3'-nucleotidase [Virgisporangium aliadipatigenens]